MDEFSPFKKRSGNSILEGNYKKAEAPKKSISSARPEPVRQHVRPAQAQEYEQPSRSTKKNRKGKKLVVVAIILILLGGFSAAGYWYYQKHQAALKAQKNPAPASVAKAVNFPLYYPNQAKLPAGYHLDKQSIGNPVKNGVSYAVTYGTDKKIVFSLQPRPSDTELESFKSNYIPLHTSLQTSLGQAEIGAYNSLTLVSLPVLNGPWIILTAPTDINMDMLKQVVNSLEAAQ